MVVIQCNYSLMYLQLRNLIKQIVNSPTICVDLQTACAKIDTKEALMVHDISTHWNSTSELLERAIKLHRALNLLVGHEQDNQSHSAYLQHFKLSVSEWELLEQLRLLLECMYIYICPSLPNMLVPRHFQNNIPGPYATTSSSYSSLRQDHSCTQ